MEEKMNEEQPLEDGLLTVEGTTLRYAPDDGSAAVELENALTDSEKKMILIT